MEFSLKSTSILTIIIFLVVNNSSAQSKREIIPVNERDICFFYCEVTLPGERDYKVVLFSSYLYRSPLAFGYNSPSGILNFTQFQNSLSNAFFSKNKRITSDESTGYAYNSIHLGYPEVQWSYFNNTSAAGPYELYATISSTTGFLERVRDKVIADYRSKGYTILQTNFSEYFDEQLRKAEVEQVSKLSSLIIREYSRGLLNELAKPFREKSSSNESSGSSSTKKEEDPDKWKRQVEIDRYLSAQLEAEGDRLEKMGSAFALSAYEKYKQAYNLSPSQRVKEKMDAISAYFVVAQGINKLGDGIANAIETIDPKKKTRFALAEFRYAGLFTSSKNSLNQSGESPSLSTVGFLGHRTCLSLGVRFGYLVAPAMEYTVKNLQTGTIINETMRVQQSAVTLGLSGGLNIPLRNLVISGLYSYDFGFTVGEKILSPGFDYDSDASSKFVSSYPMMSTYSLGFNHVFPKAGIGWGVYYNISSMKGEEDGGLITYKPNAGTSHSLQNTTQEKYKFSNISISLFFFSKGEKKK